MINVFRHRRRTIALFFVLLFAAEVVTPTAVYALTSGPSQPEVQSFQPAGTTDMVDLFSGDFSYNIPLFELPGPNGGYPFNLAYQAGITMDQEASWVGLGWSLNPGAITRQMRGLPDEFKGDPVYTKMSINPNVTVGLGAGASVEVFGGDNASLNVGFSVSHNNFKGVGYTIDGSVGFSKANSSGAGVGLDFSLDSKEGVNLSPSIGLGTKIGQFGLSVGYNSKSGLSSLALNHSFSRANEGVFKEGKNKELELEKVKLGFNSSNSVAISLAHPGYTPQVTMPMRSVNISTTLKFGGASWGIFGSPYVTGFYNEQWLKDDKKRIQAPAYGYLNYQHVTDAKALLDFNREKDGMVTKETPNLGIPSLTYDIYSVVGQGISAMYRPMRNDYGMVHDQQTTSKSTSVGTGVDVGVPTHIGLNTSVNHAQSTSGPWTDNNDLKSSATFQKKNINDAYEPWYFKVHGEPTAESVNVLAKLGGEKAVRVKLTNGYSDAKASNTLENKTWSQPAPASASSNRERKERSQVVQAITNGELMKDTLEMMPLFKIKYLDQSGTEQEYDRTSRPDHHIAGFTALTPEGLRYNYGIPAYNIHQEEVTFSALKESGQVSRVNAGDGGNGDPSYDHDDTDKFLKRVELPPYAHAHLLTSIVGPDYVDVTGNGVTADDLGYWVKFTYKNTTSSESYKWRDPFSKAHFQEGWKTDPRDDKGSFVYGEKEMWYLVKAETKSHISTFTLEEREDARGVAAKLQDTDITGKSVFALKEIKLFSRFAGETVPIKVVKFDYDYSRCPSVYNNVNDNGKLTLKKVWFEYGSSTRGHLNPYQFTYHESNPSYDILASDRWGNYKPYPADEPYYNHDFPYSEQDPSKKQEIDAHAAAWSLKEIQLPSGAKVIVDYESDDYAYVQHKQAMQMTDIVDPYADPETVASEGEFALDYDSAKIRFRLEKPITGTLTALQQQAEVMKYLDRARKQLYFKVKINLRSSSENFHEYISGYADIDFTPSTMGLESAGGNYVYGFFHLKKESGSHPFSMRVWQHLRTNQPELANSGRKLKQTNSTGERVDQIKSLGSIAAQVKQMFGGFYNFCKGKNWGKEVVAGKSWIRLNSPDKIKYGGGLRVKQITMKDAWNDDQEGVYGQVYDYTMDEGGGVISSGVAAYEPFIGGDENSLRYAKKFTQSIPLRADNNLFFEYPINESYFPGPQIGYRKVTVMSLASASLAGKPVANIRLSDDAPLFPQGEGVSYGTSGMTTHEFFTAKDFPVITDETEKDDKPYKLPLMIPFIGSINIAKLTTTQGYSIVTNDMHGKQKKVSNYRQDKSGRFEPEPISWIRYNYASTGRVYEQEKVFSLSNTFRDNLDGTLSLATANDLSNPQVPKYTLGQENEFFADMRQYEDKAWSGGVRVNVDLLFVVFGVIPVAVPWPSIGKTTNTLRTAVTNKVIFKCGVLQSTDAFDGGSMVTTENLKWDKHTGSTVLTRVNNNFNAPVFSYTVPAYTQYKGMGAAYRNIGLTFNISNVTRDIYKPTQYQFAAAVGGDKLFEGDEILLFATGEGDLVDPIARVVYGGEEGGLRKLYSHVPLTASAYRSMIVRSGYRNQLTVAAGSITALQDPSTPGQSAAYSKTISIPVEQ